MPVFNPILPVYRAVLRPEKVLGGEQGGSAVWAGAARSIPAEAGHYRRRPTVSAVCQEVKELPSDVTTLDDGGYMGRRRGSCTAVGGATPTRNGLVACVHV